MPASYLVFGLGSSHPPFLLTVQKKNVGSGLFLWQESPRQAFIKFTDLTLHYHNHPVESVGDVLLGLMRLHTQAEQLIRDRVAFNRHRIIEIDNKGVGLLDFDLKPDEQEKLIQSGRRATVEFFSEEPCTIGGFILPSIDTQKHVSLPPPLPRFVLREDHLRCIRSVMLSSDFRQGSPVQKLILHGLGGVGKTELACHFANVEFTNYSLVFWLDSESQEKLHAGYTRLAKAIGLHPEEKDDLDTIRNHVHDRLEQYPKPYLLIYDNVEKRIPLPARGGFVLITTQDGQLWQEDLHPVGSFSIEEAMSVLEQVTPRSTPDERRQLAEELEKFPLALGQAAAYLNQEGTSIPEYRAKLSQGMVEQGTQRHPASLVKTWGIILEKLKEHHPKALAWLIACAYFDPNNIPETVLDKWLDLESASGRDPLLQPRDLLRALKSYSLISWEPMQERFSLHRRMQDLLRFQDSHNQPDITLGRVIETLCKSYTEETPTTEQLNYNRCLLAHFEAALNHAEVISLTVRSNQEAQARLSRFIGEMYWDLASYDLSLTALDKSMRFSGIIWGDKSVEVAYALDIRGRVCEDKGDYDQAIKDHDRALTIKQDKLGPKHSAAAISLSNLGAVYYVQGQYADAMKFHKRARDIRKEMLGLQHPHYAVSLNNLGRVYFSNGQYEDAIKLFEQAQRIWRDAQGENHPQFAFSLNNLGSAHHRNGNHDKAVEFCKKAITNRKKALGERHPHVAFSLNKLGDVYYDMDDHVQARDCHNQALSIREETLGKQHPHYAISLNSQGTDYCAQPDYDRAMQCHSEALRIQLNSHSLRADHPAIAISRMGIGIVDHAKGEYDQAIKSHAEALRIRKKALVSNHPDVAVCLHHLGLAYKGQRDWTNARTHLQEAYEIAQKHPSMGPSHPKTQIYKKDLESLSKWSPMAKLGATALGAIGVGGILWLGWKYRNDGPISEALDSVDAD